VPAVAHTNNQNLIELLELRCLTSLYLHRPLVFFSFLDITCSSFRVYFGSYTASLLYRPWISIQVKLPRFTNPGDAISISAQIIQCHSIIMSSHVVVIDSTARRATIKTNPSKPLADVLQEACSKLGLNASQYGLK
jgi:hypothetical protein